MPRSESPFIIGPERYGVDAQEPPTFHLELGRNRYWAVEVATDANLFNGGNRNDSTFFDSWRRGLRRTDSPTTYTLPPEAWDALRGTNPPRLYYRLLTAAADDARWPGLETSLPTGDLGHAPYITLTRGLARKIIGESVSNLRNRNEAQWRDPV